ncbi:bacterio-opsin activator domain-containing protein [Halorientalis pallida]|uniref:GAF domain-containing protein n=1 Tax=Halorientalis pallida TaxID=2479928 RepID=A0A498L652_9EURY|nr:bacterio-opsin activator domain-containing protein [Halorientalis pallida]RXK51205.1 GAF domain-containing protein [Halorientalis pallida]
MCAVDTDVGTTVTPASYRRLRRATDTLRAELVVRLVGEVGLRAAEIARVRPADVGHYDRDGTDHYFVAVPDDDGGTDRRAYLPPDVEHDLRQFARANDVDDGERLVPVSPRRVQMLVAETGERAADRTGDERFRSVSSRTLRQFFARRLLAEEGVDPHVVATVGGWGSLERVERFLPDLDRADVAAAFERTSLVEGADGPSADGPTVGSRFDAAFERIRAAADALSTASTRGGVERRTCERLVDGEPYAVAWIGQQRGDAVGVAAQAGAGAVELDGVSPEDGAVGAALSTDEVRTTDDVQSDPAFGAWRDHADATGYRAAAVVPVGDGESTDSVLGVGTVAPVTDRERALLSDLGRRIGQAITVVEQRKLLLADTVVELTFESGDQGSFFAGLSAEHDCTLTLDGVVPGEDGALVYFVTLSGAGAEQVLSWATDRAAVDDARLVRDYGDESLLELVVSGPDVATTLVDHGATVGEMDATAGTERVVGQVSAETDVRQLVATVTDAFPDTELVTKRERDRPAETPTAFRASLRDSLTEKQSAVLQAAFHAGYFEWPRGSTAEELADAIGITSPTLHNHLRRAQQKLLTAFFTDDQRPGDPESPWAED